MAGLFMNNLVYGDRPYRLRQIRSGEKRDFNRYIESSSLGTVFQTYEWGELKKRSGWTPIRLVLEEGEAVLGAATVLKRSAAGLTIFYSPRGPVLDYEHPDLLLLFCRGLAPLARHENAAFWRMDPELDGTPEAPACFTRPGLKPVPPDNPFGGIQPRWVWRIPLAGDPQKQWEALKKGCRRQIKKARLNGVEIREASEKELPLFYGLLKDTAESDGFRLRDASYYRHLLRQLSPACPVKILLAYHNDKPVSTALAVGFGRGVWDIYAGNSQSDKDLGASYLLTWELIDWACREGFSFYDLGGIAPQAAEGDSLAGLQFFKSRFGGGQVEFAGEYDLVFNPLAYRLWRAGQRGLRVLRRHEKALRSKNRRRLPVR